MSFSTFDASLPRPPKKMVRLTPSSFWTASTYLPRKRFARALFKPDRFDDHHIHPECNPAAGLTRGSDVLEFYLAFVIAHSTSVKVDPPSATF